jgi:VanZ family protein
MSKGLIFWRLVFVAYFILLSWQLLTPVMVVSPGEWDKIIHFSGFFVLGGLAILAAWKGTPGQTIFALVVYAALTEIAQHFIPGRYFSVLDWGADALGVVIAVILSPYIVRRIPFLNFQFSK